MDGLTQTLQIAACQRWSFRRISLLAKLWAHCVVNLHTPVTIWGDYAGLMDGTVKPDSWAVTYSCWECHWMKPKGQ